jgi:colicin import membrane protein
MKMDTLKFSALALMIGYSGISFAANDQQQVGQPTAEKNTIDAPRALELRKEDKAQREDAVAKLHEQEKAQRLAIKEKYATDLAAQREQAKAHRKEAKAKIDADAAAQREQEKVHRQEAKAKIDADAAAQREQAKAYRQEIKAKHEATKAEVAAMTQKQPMNATPAAVAE